MDKCQLAIGTCSDVAFSQYLTSLLKMLNISMLHLPRLVIASFQDKVSDLLMLSVTWCLYLKLPSIRPLKEPTCSMCIHL